MPVSALEYHERTKHSPESVRADARRLDWENKPTPYKVYEDRPAIDLPAVDGSPEVPALRAISEVLDPSAGGTPDVDDVARLCHLALGVTKVLELGGREHEFRAAACTGALYHVDGYLVAGEGVGARGRGGTGSGDPGGLDAGVYHFDPRGPAFDVLRQGDYRGVLTRVTGDHPRVAEAPLSIVLASTWWRNAWKYRERTYRHAFWDSGTILANLLAAARGLDLPATVVAGFADGAVSALLGVDPREEGPVAVVPVGAGDPSPDPVRVEPIDPETRQLSPDPIEYGLIGDAYEASSLADGATVRAWRDATTASTKGDGQIVSRGPGDGERVSLDPVDDERAAKTPLPVTVRRRGSAREYAREPLSFGKVSTVLDRATRGVPMDVGGGNRAGHRAPLALNDLYLVVSGVEDVEPGTYQFHRGPSADGAPNGEGDDGEGSDGAETVGEDGHGGPWLERLRAGEFRGEAGHLALDQRLAADAAVCAFFLTDLDAVVEAMGDRGYRAAQLEAAITAGRLYLAAYAHRDLGATGLTFYDDSVTEFFSPRAEGQTPTFCWTLGRPA